MTTAEAETEAEAEAEAEASHIVATSIGKGRFDLFIMERREHLLQQLVLEGRG